MHQRLPSRFLLLIAVLFGCQADAQAPAGFVTVTFPKTFLWGTASAAYQVEGNYDPNLGQLESNWSRWEEMGRVVDAQTNPRGADFYRQYPQDLERLKALGLTAIRIGIAWERVEPRNDQWNQAGLDYYVDIVKRAHELGMQPMVTFYHWVVPRWVADPSLPKGDPRRDQLAVPNNQWLWDEFSEFVAKVTPALAPYVDLYSVINEPWSVIAGSYLAGVHPPGDTLNFTGMQAVHANLAFMHARAVRVIRELDQVDADGDGKAAFIGMAKEAGRMTPFDWAKPADVNAAKTLQYAYNEAILNAWIHGALDVNWDGDTEDKDTIPPEGHYPELAGSLDWIGINYYGLTYAKGTADPSLFGSVPMPFGGGGKALPKSEIGMELRPAGFVASLEHFWYKYRLPMYITENGIADCDDNQRKRYLTEHLYALGRAMQDEGMDIRGYFQWSFVDNFEWAHGFHQCFGLFALDRSNFERTLRPGGAAYAEIVRTRTIDETRLRDAIASGYGPGTAPTFEETVAEIEAELANGAKFYLGGEK